MDAFDAVVIGAGHNGLAAAVHLLKRGWSVAVFEQAGEPGGAVKTREITLPGFRHDLCAMNLSMFAGSSFFAAHKDELAAHGLAFAPAADCFASVFRDHTSLGVSKDVEKTVAAIAEVSAKDAAAWRMMLARFGEDAPFVFGLLGSPMPSFAAVRTLWSAWRAKGLSWLLDLGRLLLATPRDFLDAHFESPKVKAMMAAWGMHLDFPPDVAGGALFPYLESMADQAFGLVIGAGGAAVIIRAMTGLIRAKGGEIRLKSPVAGIESDATGATGVKLGDGTRIAAKKAVIANLNPRIVFDRLIDPDPRRKAFDDKVADIRPGPGTLMIHLALDSLPDWLAGHELKGFAYVHVAPDLAMMSRAFAEASAGLLPAEPVLVVGQPTAIDPTRAPPGKHVLWIQVRVLPATIAGDALGRIHATAWDEAKEPYAERVLDILETYAPRLREKILGRAVWSPLDLERENPCLIGGDNLTGSHHLDQNFFFRPVPGYSRYATPVPRLYLCGAATWPGAGTGAASGYMLAKMLAR
jgi:phytoene dehydrogenase-like protein